jgi:F-type H+-transporting ATPase subunit gamma
MNELQKVEDRITSIRELKGLFRAMRVMAASHVQQAQLGLDGARRYARIVQSALAEAALLLPGDMGHLNGGSSNSARQVIVICSEHGFVGALNDKLLDTAADRSSADHGLLVVGRRGVILAEERNLTTDWTAPMPTHLSAIPKTSGAIISKLNLDTPVEIVFARYKGGGGYGVEARQIVPMDLERITSGSKVQSPPLHHLPPGLLLRQLIGEYLFAAIAHAMIESLASENGARMQIMQQADRNIDAKLDVLIRNERAQRQEAITSELLDVVTGSEAMRS